MHNHTIRRMAALVSIGWVLAAVALWTSAAVPASAFHPFKPRLQTSPAEKPSPKAPAVVAEVTTLPKRTTPLPKVRVGDASAGMRTSRRAPSGSAGVTQVARTSAPRSSVSEIEQARALLAAQIAKHPILRGTTVTFGNAQGYQAISYYQTGEIILSRTHTASLSTIIAHEVWHIIDWRDNGRIDWGENVPR